MSRVRRFPDFRLLMSVALGGIALLGAQQVGIALLGAQQVGIALLGAQQVGIALLGPQQVALQPGARVVSPSDARAVDSGYQPIVSPTTRLPAGSDYAPNEVIVKSVGRAAQRTAAQWMASGLGVSGVERPRFANFDVLSLEPGTDPVVVARTLSERDDVEYAQPSYLRHPQFVPNDPLFAQQWNMSAIDMQRAWDINPGSSDAVIVAIIDSGAAFEDASIQFEARAFTMGGVPYPALGPITVPFAAAPELGGPDRFVAPFDFIWMDDHPVDFTGHGTHVSGTVGQLTNNSLGVAGVAFNVRIMPLKVLGDWWDFVFGATPACCGGRDADVAVAIRYAVESGAQVINMSLGGPEPSPVIDDAMRFAVDRGVFVAVAGGNSFEDDNAETFPAASANEIDGAVSVGAVDRSLRRAFYSSTGPYVEIVAPGGEQRAEGETGGVLQQTLDAMFTDTFLLPPSQYGPPRFDILSFSFFQGTSMAAPHVAGLAALLITQGITDPAAIEAAIERFAVDLGEPGRDDEYGFGLINPSATLRGLGLAR